MSRTNARDAVLVPTKFVSGLELATRMSLAVSGAVLAIALSGCAEKHSSDVFRSPPSGGGIVGASGGVPVNVTVGTYVNGQFTEQNTLYKDDTPFIAVQLPQETPRNLVIELYYGNTALLGTGFQRTHTLSDQEFAARMAYIPLPLATGLGASPVGNAVYAGVKVPMQGAQRSSSGAADEFEVRGGSRPQE